MTPPEDERAPDSAAEGALLHGLDEMQLSLSQPQIERLLVYVAELRRWNKAYNLTALREPEELVRRHVLESLALIPHVVEQRAVAVLDVGSGAGLPGLVLAIGCPELTVTLLDPSLKRTRFLTQVVHDLPVPNARVLRRKLDQVAREERYHVIVSRATMHVDALVAQAAALLVPGGKIVAMLGQCDDSLSRRLGGGFEVSQHGLAVPGIEAARHVAIVRVSAAGSLDG